ncbi:MAG: MFS transporter [Oscillospiraceae bacterium]
MKLRNIFVPSAPPTDAQMRTSSRTLLAEGAIASSLFALGTGNFLAGYLTLLGATPAFCAMVATLPQFGCVLQLVSPFLFEKLRWRKLTIIIGCFCFRFSIGFAVLAPILFKSTNARLSFMFALYLFAFMAAGFITPGLNRWVMEIAPEQKRGAYFAIKTIIGSVTNAVVALIMGRQLDYFISSGKPYIGYFVVFGTSLVMAIIDTVLLCTMKEKPSLSPAKLNLASLAMPLRDTKYRGFILVLIIWSFTIGLGTPFLPVHLLRNLQLSHTFITAMGIASAVAAMLGTWLWGRMADRYSWQKVFQNAGLVVAAGYICWGFVSKETAVFAAPVIMCAVEGCNGAFNTASLNLQYFESPQSGKTVYLGVTSALANISSVLAVMAGTLITTLLSPIIGEATFNVLLTSSGILCVAVLMTYRLLYKHSHANIR